MKPRVVSGMRPTGKLHLGHLVGRAEELGRRCRSTYDCFYFVADWHALTSDYADTAGIVANALDMVGRLDRRRPRPRAQHAVRPVARARARRAVPAAVDDRADPVARARADLQGADGAAGREGPLDARVPRLSAAADGGRHHLRRAVRAGRRGSGAAPGAVSRDRAAVPQLLRRAVRRAAAAADAGAAPAGARQPQDVARATATPSTCRTMRRRCGRR